MTFGNSFGRTFSPTFRPKSQAKKAGGGWWDLDGTITSCVAAYQPKGAASYAASKTDLSNSGNTAADGSAYPTWDDTNGWKFAHTSSQYLTTTLIPTTNTSAIVRFSNGWSGTGNHGFLIGSYSGNDTTRFEICCFFASMHLTSHGNYALNTPYYTSGVLAVAGTGGYYDGTKVDTLSGWSGTATAAIHIGRQNGYTNYFTGYIQALAIYSATLTSTQVGDLTTAMAAL